MSEAVVIVTGSRLSPLGVLPFQSHDAPPEGLEKVLSHQEYGNHLPTFWNLVRHWALAPSLDSIPLLHRKIQGHSFPVITATVDGLHKQAGSYPVVETFGSLFQARCLRCHHEMELDRHDLRLLEVGQVPECEECGKERVRPDLVLRGEHLKHRRLADDFVQEAEAVYFVGVDAHDPLIQKWAQLARKSVLVAPEELPGFTEHLALSPEAWAEADCPLS